MLELFEVTDSDVTLSNSRNCPRRDDIPKEYFDTWNKWNKVATSWFFRGLGNKGCAKPKEGVDVQKAFRAVRSVMGCFDLEHNHKIAACAYMLGEWFHEMNCGERK